LAYRVILLPGDGIGPEVMTQARAALDVVSKGTGASFDIEEIACGGQYYLKHGSRDWPEGSEERCRAADLILLGAVGWPSPDGNGPVIMSNGQMAGWSPVIGNRMKLDLYANVRPVKMWPGVKHRIHGRNVVVWEPAKVDMIIVRENTEGLYSGIGGFQTVGSKRTLAIDTRVITRQGSERVIRYAFELSRRRNKGAPKDGKKRVTAIAKDNVLKGCQLFLEVFHEVGKEYPDIEKDTAIVDAFTQWLIGQPEYYDVCVTTNMFGDIVTDLASVLQGGMGMAAGCNVGDEHGMFEPIHGSAPKHAGKNRSNPIAMLLATAEGLRWLGQRKKDTGLVQAGDALEASVASVLAAGSPLTYDLAGEDKGAPTTVVGEAICSALKSRLKK
jgi:isocitrate/isopropylmalate dehydrogenase